MRELLSELERRASAASEAMARHGLEYLVLTPSPNFRYLAGFYEETYERIELLILTSSGERVLLIPSLSTPPQWVHESFDVVMWSDSDNVSSIMERIFSRLRIFGKPGVFEDSMSLRIFTTLKDLLQPSRIAMASEILKPLRMRKSLYEIERISRAVKAAERIFEEAYRLLAPGLTEKFVASQILGMIHSEGLDQAFQPVVAFGENTASPHHVPSQRILAHGDLVILDLGVVYEGYVSDLTRLFSLGQPPRRVLDVFASYSQCFSEAMEGLRPGMPASEVDLRTRRCLSEQGLGGYLVHRTGHGIGLEIHEPPYLSIGSEDLLERGSVFTIEPGIYVRNSFGLRLESNVAVLDNGDIVVLDRISRDIIQL